MRGSVSTAPEALWSTGRDPWHHNPPYLPLARAQLLHPSASDLSLFRRNIIISGINPNELIGERFSIGDVAFEGIGHCSPCTWMDAVMGKGVYRMMVGRGGLRAKVTAGGTLKCGREMLQCEKALLLDPRAPLVRKKLP